MFFRKKKKVLFGGKIEPSCFYCYYNSSEDEIVCPHGNAVCRKYQYDPLKRTPSTAPAMREYTKDDFSL